MECQIFNTHIYIWWKNYNYSIWRKFWCNLILFPTNFLKRWKSINLGRYAINVCKNCKLFWYFLFCFTYFYNTDFFMSKWAFRSHNECFLRRKQKWPFHRFLLQIICKNSFLLSRNTSKVKIRLNFRCRCSWHSFIDW